jgi:hypothetical protein
MMLDKENLILDAFAMTGWIVGNNVSANNVALWGAQQSAGVPVAIPGPVGNSTANNNLVPKDFGRGPEVELLAQIVTAATSGGAATLQLQVIMADAADLTTGQVILCETPAIAVATLVAGYRFRVDLPPGGITKRYLGVRAVVATAVFTAGNITVALVADQQTFPYV